MTAKSHTRVPEPQAPLPADTPTLEADTSSPPRRILRGIRTFESFKHRDYTFFFFGALLSNIGTWTQTVALGWVIYALTRSSASLGIVNFLSGIPIFFLTLFAGSLVDHVDRRKLLIWSQFIMMGQAVAFAYLNYTGHITMEWIYSLTLAAGVVSAFMFPAWQAMVPDLVPRSSLLNAVALSSAQFNAARLVGPMVTATIMAAFAANESLGITLVFAFNAASFLFVIWALAVIRPAQEMQRHVEGQSVRRTLGAGLAYARDHRHVAAHLFTAAMLTIFGMPFMTLLPAIAVDVLGLGSTGYSSLMIFNGAGALVGALAVASLPASFRRERIIGYGLTTMALGSVALSFSRSYALSCVLLTVLGAAFLACVSSINTNLQTAAPNYLRGRIMALFVIAFMGMMPFGALAFGALGDLVGPSRAVLTGGLVLLLWALYLLARPAILCPRTDPECPSRS
ncbi:MAG: MFS transporter [Coriobacteriia bacterium]|nr:MFS transporter [Coriobacteriia bacterium]